MSKTFRPWKIDEPQFLPPTAQDFVAKEHLARFMVSLVTEELDLTEITASSLGEKGQPPFHPAMMTALLLYAYCCGIYSSRRIAKACRERVDFMSIVALDQFPHPLRVPQATLEGSVATVCGGAQAVRQGRLGEAWSRGV